MHFDQGSLADDGRPTRSSASFADILQRRAAQKPDAQAFVYLDTRGEIESQFTFSELHRRARIVARELGERNLGRKRVLLMFPPGLDFVAALFGCFYANVIAVPIPSVMRGAARERAYSIIQDCKPSGVLTLSRCHDVAPQHRTADLAGIPRICTDLLGAEGNDWEPRSSSLGDVALIQYTSGSTTGPKGVVLSHANLMANSAMIAEAFGHDESLRGVGWLPTFHDMGLIGHVLQPVYVGGLSILMSPVSFVQSPIRWLKAISDWRGTTSGGPTYAFDHCVKMTEPDQTNDLDLSSWVVAYCGSEKVRAEVLGRFETVFEPRGFSGTVFLPCYGLAESTLMATSCERGRGIHRSTATPRCDGLLGGSVQQPAVSCGCPPDGTKVVVVDPDNRTLKDQGEIGEIWCRGPQVGLGYWNRRSETELTFQAHLASGSEPYLRTGDLGFMRNGELFLTGRMKDVINVRGLKRTAEDLESVIAQSHSLFGGFVNAAFGVEIDGQEQLVVIQEVGTAALQPENRCAAIRCAFASITREHGLRMYDLVLVRIGSLPRTASGKVQRSRSRIMYGSGKFARIDAPDCRPRTQIQIAPIKGSS